MKLRDFMAARDLCGSEFMQPSWDVWRGPVAALYDGDATELSAEHQALALKLTGRTTLPTEPPRELYVGAGRRSGKTRFASVLGVHAAAQDYRNRLAPGEVATVALVAPDRKQAGLLLDYCRGIVEGSEVMRSELVRETAESLEFAHRTRIEVHTGSFRSVRGYTMALAVIDEAAFLRDESSAVPDIELARALRPALLTMGGRLVVISSPHRKVGLMYDAFKRYYGTEIAA